MTSVERLRLSLGTAIELGLSEGRLDVSPTTAFLMTYREGKCDANCAFCPQARESTSKTDRLSRIVWPDFPFLEVIERQDTLRRFRRICLQCLNYPSVDSDAVEIVKGMREVYSGPISVCIHPIPESSMERIRSAGATDIGIALDACTARLFDEIKGRKRRSPYTWRFHMESLKKAFKVFGQDHVTTHLIIGLGESEEDAARMILRLYSMGIRVGLFAFTSIEGTELENSDPPSLSSYRRLQVVRYLASREEISEKDLEVDSDGRVTIDISESKLREALSSGMPFMTSGCPGCNRPYYHERPRGPMYNYPRRLTDEEIQEAIQETGLA
ncbi:radical SAM protein [Candidatus Thorarchaeota archaeon]|nr:MAG: radical SAM protein [Candidatus Thorarchaeota archaeon]